MQRRSFEDMKCSVAQALDVVGEWWTLLILRDAILGVTRFDEFQSRLGISRNVLSTRLETLVDHEILERVRYQDRPPRDEYRLTRKGRALWPVLTALREWGDRWVVGKDNASVVLHHHDHACDTVLHCRQCGEQLRGADLHFERGPGPIDAGFLPLDHPLAGGQTGRRLPPG